MVDNRTLMERMRNIENAAATNVTDGAFGDDHDNDIDDNTGTTRKAAPESEAGDESEASQSHAESPPPQPKRRSRSRSIRRSLSRGRSMNPESFDPLPELLLLEIWKC